MFTEKFCELQELRDRLEVVKDSMVGFRLEDYTLTFREILKIAMLADSLSNFEYGTVVCRINLAAKYRSKDVLNSCIEYVECLFRMTEDFLKLKVVESVLIA